MLGRSKSLTEPTLIQAWQILGSQRVIMPMDAGEGKIELREWCGCTCRVTPQEYIAFRQAGSRGGGMWWGSICYSSNGQIPRHRTWGQTPRLPTSVVWLRARLAFPGHLFRARHQESRADVKTAWSSGAQLDTSSRKLLQVEKREPGGP